MSKVIKTNDQFEVSDTINTGGVVVVDFSAPAWCIPCQRLAPHFEEAAKRSTAVFIEVDVDNAPWALVDYNVQAVPTVMVFKDGEFVKQIARTPSERTVVKLLQDIGA